MRVMVLVKATKQSEAGELPTHELLGDMLKFNEELVRAGVMLDGEGLQPSSKGKRVHFQGDRRTVKDGPFDDPTELVAGYWVWKVKSMDEAVEWARQCPPPMKGEAILEIRPLFEAEDFGEVLTPELRAKEEALRAQTARYH